MDAAISLECERRARASFWREIIIQELGKSAWAVHAGLEHGRDGKLGERCFYVLGDAIDAASIREAVLVAVVTARLMQEAVTSPASTAVLDRADMIGIGLVLASAITADLDRADRVLATAITQWEMANDLLDSLAEASALIPGMTAVSVRVLPARLQPVRITLTALIDSLDP
jgi:hypothetical protein